MNDRKQQVLLTAQRLFIEKGFAATSVQDILDESHISKGTFYNYFSSKNECLMAILVHAYEIADARRQELLVGKNRSEKEIFVKQIAIRMEVNREYQLIPLFEAIFHSKDPELREFAKKHNLAELSWLSERLVDVYGEDASPYAVDLAIMIVGMMKHFINVWVNDLKEEIDIQRLIQFISRRTDVIISDLIHSKEKLLGDYLFLPLSNSLTEEANTRERILESLLDFSRSLPDTHQSKQYVDFLVEEIQSEHPRSMIMEPILRAFAKSFTDTPMELKAKKLAFDVYYWSTKEDSQ